MIRRDFMRSAVALGTLSSGAVSLNATTGGLSKKKGKAKYRAGVVGLGWTGLLYDIAKRDGSHRRGPYWIPPTK